MERHGEDSLISLGEEQAMAAQVENRSNVKVLWMVFKMPVFLVFVAFSNLCTVVVGGECGVLRLLAPGELRLTELG